MICRPIEHSIRSNATRTHIKNTVTETGHVVILRPDNHEVSLGVCRDAGTMRIEAGVGVGSAGLADSKRGSDGREIIFKQPAENFVRANGIRVLLPHDEKALRHGLKGGRSCHRIG